MSDKPLLEVINMSTHFHTQDGIVKAVDGVSYAVNREETLGLVGESGCGKTVSALSILRLIPDPPGKIIAGQIMFDGQDILSLPKNKMEDIRGDRIAMIFQEPLTSLDPVLTIVRQITEALERHRDMHGTVAMDEAIRLLKLVGIPQPDQRVKDYPHQFSGGMRQRLGIARALALQPSFIVCDEPISALDVSIQAQIINLLDDLGEQFGIAYLFISHDLAVVRYISDRVAVMYLGKIMEIADRDSLYESPLHPYTQALLSAVPIPDPSVEKQRNIIILKGEVPSPINPPAGCVFHPRCFKVFEPCATTVPLLADIGDGHQVACLHYPTSVPKK